MQFAWTSRNPVPYTDMRIHPVFHVSLLEPFRPSPFPGRPRLNPILEVLPDNSNEYEVDSILDSRIRGRRKEYLIRWKGYSSSDDSWEPYDNVSAPAAVADFHAQYPDKPGPWQHLESAAYRGDTVMNDSDDLSLAPPTLSDADASNPAVNAPGSNRVTFLDSNANSAPEETTPRNLSRPSSRTPRHRGALSSDESLLPLRRSARLAAAH